MYDPRRLVAPAAAVALVLGLMAAEALVLSAASGARLERIPKHGSFMDANVYNDIGGRVAAVVREERTGPGEGPPLGLLLGSSVLHWNIDPAVLDRECAGRIRWLSLHGDDMNAEDMADSFELAVRGGLRPRVVVIAYSPFQLARISDLSSEEAVAEFKQILGDLAAGRAGGIRGRIKEVGPFLRGLFKSTFPSRTLFNNTVRRNLFEGKSWIFGHVGVAADESFVPSPDPWHAAYPRPGILKMDPGTRTALMKECRNRGWFSAESYRGGGDYGQALMDLIRRARSLGAVVVLVRVPLSTIVRAELPPEGARCLDELLASSFGADAPAVLDYSTRMPDDAFYDHAHLNYRTRQDFSRIVGKDLNDTLDRTIGHPGPSASRD